MLGSQLSVAQRQTFYGFILLTIVLLLTGCIPSPTQNELLPVSTTTTTEKETAISVTASVSPVHSTIMPEASETQLPTISKIPSTQNSTPSPTPVPTLTKGEEEVLLQELMATNGGCRLPCWWGFDLGDPLSSVGETFSNWGAAPWRVTTSGDEYGYINLRYHEPGQSIAPVHVYSQFYTLDGNVRFMKISGGRSPREYGETEFIRDWEKFFLPSILQTYGKPTRAYFIPGNIGDPGRPNHSLFLYYPDLGINVAYSFFGNQLNDEVNEVCLTLNNVFLIQLFLYETEFAANWPVDNLLGFGKVYESYTIENYLGMDLDRFYETYRDPGNLGCIQIQ